MNIFKRLMNRYVCDHELGKPYGFYNDTFNMCKVAKRKCVKCGKVKKFIG